jgi:small multidrug export protein
MLEHLTESLVEKMSSFLIFPFGKQLVVFIISLLPILEARGGLIAASIIELDMLESIIIAFIGNIIPMFFIVFFFEHLYKFMRRSKIKFLNSVANFVDKRVDKHRASIEKYDFWGLVLFIGIPLPGTGAWTGCVIASILQMEKKKTVLASILGVLMATAIMTVFSFGFLKKVL